MRKILLAILLGLSCCTANKKENDATEKSGTSKPDTMMVDNEFTRYLDLLPIIPLPFETDCERCCDHPEIDYDNELVIKFKPELATVVGLISRTKNRSVILVTYPADVLVPSLKVYDANGKLTGDMTFMTSYCGGEPGYYGTQFFRIASDLKMSQIDTSYYMAFDTVSYQTLDTTKIEITKKEYKINNKGKIVEDTNRGKDR